ncbi:MAG TPA: hypothetical protein DD434_13225 [Bacteroidales bacterium]|nr:hypothetical protein [Bacteroidales bacterium]
MKKLTLILLSLISLASFNSCKDEEPEQTPTKASIFTELKSYTGKNYEQVSTIIESKDFTLSYTESVDLMRLYFFINSDSTCGYAFGEYNDIIFVATYNYFDNNKSILQTNYEKNSQIAVSFVGNDPSLYYFSNIIFFNSDNSELEFDKRADYLKVYNQNIDSIGYCSETWISQNAIIGTEFNYDKYDFPFSLVGYADMLHMPIMYDNSENISIFDLLKHKK